MRRYSSIPSSNGRSSEASGLLVLSLDPTEAASMRKTIAIHSQRSEARCPSFFDTRSALIREVRLGLNKRPRSLAPWMFYDARGSRLFERITTLPEYYPTRTERDIFTNCAEAIVTTARGGTPRSLRLVELGAGTASKTGILLKAMVRMQGEVRYVPVDISPNAIDVARQSITSSLPEVHVAPLVVNYVTHPPELEPVNGITLAMYIGSSIGNFSPEEARVILQNLGSQLRAGDALLLGTDMVKDESTLVAAYDDSDGVTAAFNLNILHRLNRELGADFDPANFRHRAIWNHAESRIEMHLESTQEHKIFIPSAQLHVHFNKHETIHTENSYKFTRQAIRVLLEDAGFDVERTWMDDRGWYAVTLARMTRKRNQYQTDLCAGSRYSPELLITKEEKYGSQ
jgi:L-histidine N-alpha-methyltransferase